MPVYISAMNTEAETAIVLGVENDRPDRPIVQPVVIACIIEDGRRGDLQGDTHYDSSRPTNSASLMWATFGLLFFNVE
jgi:hypothetical protein